MYRVIKTYIWAGLSLYYDHHQLIQHGSKGFAKFIIVFTTVSAAIMELIDTSIVNVALNDMAGSIGVSIEDDISWIITSYAIANVIIIPLTGFLADYFGRKNYHIASMILFTFASYMCGQSHGLVELIAWRFIQGVGVAHCSLHRNRFSSTHLRLRTGLSLPAFWNGDRVRSNTRAHGRRFHYRTLQLAAHFMINIPIGIIATILAYSFVEKSRAKEKEKNPYTLTTTGSYCLPLALVACNMCWNAVKQKIGLAAAL